MEASPAMAELQASTIQASQFTAPSSSSSPGSLKGVELGEQELGQGEKVMGSGCYQSGRMAGDVAVAWYKQLKDVPQGLDEAVPICCFSVKPSFKVVATQHMMFR